MSCSVLSLLLAFFFIPNFVRTDDNPIIITPPTPPNQADFVTANKGTPICKNDNDASAACLEFGVDEVPDYTAKCIDSDNTITLQFLDVAASFTGKLAQCLSSGRISAFISTCPNGKKCEWAKTSPTAYSVTYEK